MASRRSGWSRRSSRHGLRGFGDLLRSKRVRRRVLYGLIALFAGYCLIWLVQFYIGSTAYADVALNSGRPDALYALGRPERVRSADGSVKAPANEADLNAATGWLYRSSAGGDVEVRFDPAGIVESIGCRHNDVQPFSCPALYAIPLGTTEDVVMRRLGSPTRTEIVGGAKRMIYADIGATYELQRFRVFAVSLSRDQGGFFAKTGRYLRSLVP